MAATIQDITNPNLSYEERARLRRERRENRVKSTDLNAGKRPSSPFRTHSPTIQPSQAPTLGFTSEFAYISSMSSSSPRGSPSPLHKTFLDAPSLDGRNRAISEPVDMFNMPPAPVHRKETNGVIDDDTSTYTGQVYPKHTPANTSYDSRTPRLVRGALNKTNIIYRKDLDDFNKQDITVVMFPRDTATLERNSGDRINDENTPKGSLKKGGLTIVPTQVNEPPVVAIETSSTTPQPHPPPTAVVSSSDESKSEKSTRKLSKTFSFLSKKEKSGDGGKKKSPKAKRRKNSSTSAEKKLSSGGLSQVSMPNLYSPTSDESDTNEGTGKASGKSFFKRKQDKKSNVQRTSWTFQQPDTIQPPTLQPALSLQNIAESPTDTSPDLGATTGQMNRVGSMEELRQFTSDLDAPVNIIKSFHSSDEEDDEIRQVTDVAMTTDRTPSPLSIGSISIDIPDLQDPSKPVTPLPTNNDLMNTVLGLKPVDKMAQKPSNASSEVTQTSSSELQKQQPQTEKESSDSKQQQQEDENKEKKESFSRNYGSRKPLRKPSMNSKDSPMVSVKKLSTTRQTPDSLDESPVSTSPSKISLNSSGSFGDSPVTTPTNERKKFNKSPAEKARSSFKSSKTKNVSSDLATPTNSPKVVHTPSIAKVKHSPTTSPLPPSQSPVVKAKSSPIAARKLVKSESGRSSFKKKSTTTTSSKVSPKSSPRNSPKTGRKVTTGLTFKSKSMTDASSSQTPESPMTKKRRLGITSVTSPLTEEKNLGTFQMSDKPSKIIPKRPAPSPPTYKRTPSGTSINSNKDGGTQKDNKINKPTTPLSKRKSTSALTSATKGTSETYVYQSIHKKTSDTTSIMKSNRTDPPQTYTYAAGSLKKKQSQGSVTMTTTATTTTTQQNKKISDVQQQQGNQRKSSIPSIKTTSSSSSLDKSTSGGIRGSQKSTEGLKATTTVSRGLPPKHQSSKSSTALTTRTSSPSLRKQQKLSLVETSNTQKPPQVVKSSSEDQDTTLDILKPIGSLLSSSNDKLIKGLTPPPLGSMLARPISPTSPPLSPDIDEGDISLTPEVPMDGEDQLTYVYRSTLLRKTSSGSSGGTMTRTPSNRSVGSDTAGGKRISRTGSPRKGSLAPAMSPSRRVSSGASIRRGSIGALSPVRKSSATMSMRRPSTGVTRTLEKGGVRASSTLIRPRSASQISMTQSLRKKSIAPVSSLTRQSLRNKKTSADTLLKKPPSGLQTSKRSAPLFPVKSETTDGGIVSKTRSPTHSSTPSAEIKEVPTYSKPKPITKANSSAGLENSRNTSSQIRKSIRTSKSFDPVHKPKLAETKSAYFSKPPSGSGTIGRASTKKTSTDTLARQSLKKTMSTDTINLTRTSTRMSRRSNAGTIKKVSQSDSPLHSSTKASPTHGTLNRKKDTETVDDFNYVSSMADKTKLSSGSDFRRQVRPRTNYKPSPHHLQKLSQRKDISSEMESKETSTPSTHEDDAATYMGKKKNLSKSALAGLAAKLDFSTVQLRKTGIVEQMMSDDSGGNKRQVAAVDEVHNSYGVQMTSHPLMLITIKGRKNLQVRLVEPQASSVNSGDVFIMVGEKDLFLWQGKEANVLEKARANDIVNRIHQKRELGCRASGYTHLDDEDTKKELPKRNKVFWELINGKPTMKKDVSSVPTDEVYEKGMSLATKVFQFVMEGDVGKYLIVHEDSAVPLKISLLDTKKILMFDFCSEVYVWIGKRCPSSYRKQAMIKARKHYDMGYNPPVFSNIASPKKVMPSGARQSQRFHSKMHQRHGTLSGNSIRRKTLERKPSKGSLVERPSWSLFSRVNEGSETILFREKFADWPEPGRIIKMRGHESSGELVKPPPMPELQPADVQQMLKPRVKFEGLRLEGENVHRGHGNYKVSRSTFACNRVRSQKVEKYLIKDSDNILLPEKSNGIFYNGEGYVIRWSYIITVVRELEGLTPGEGMFAKDRKYQKEVKKKKGLSVDEAKVEKQVLDEDSSDEEVNDSDEESKRVLESGGRDRVAYFFWQGEHASINEKGAAAVITVRMDTERAPQIRVPQSKEHPTFLQLFRGSMIVLEGKSSDSNNTVNDCPRGYRMYTVIGNAKKEACLIEIDVKNHSLFYYTRSKGCYVIQHKTLATLFIWNGCKASENLRGIAALATRKLKKRLNSYKVVKVNEGSEPKELNNLMGSRKMYHSLLTTTISSSALQFTSRLFHLSSSTGWFLATEEIHVSMPDSSDTLDPFPFLQEDLYNATQPALFLLDVGIDIYLWMGWWPVQKNKLLIEKNVFSGQAQSKWAKDKKLALETAMAYVEESKRNPKPTVYVVNAGTEHVEFINYFPTWNERKDVQEIVGSTTPTRTLAEKELAIYNKKTYTLEELLKRPDELDPAKLETYLSDEDFQKYFKITRDDFSKLSSWKQKGLKQSIGLF